MAPSSAFGATPHSRPWNLDARVSPLTFHAINTGAPEAAACTSCGSEATVSAVPIAWLLNSPKTVHCLATFHSSVWAAESPDTDVMSKQILKRDLFGRTESPPYWKQLLSRGIRRLHARHQEAQDPKSAQSCSASPRMLQTNEEISSFCVSCTENAHGNWQRAIGTNVLGRVLTPSAA